MGQHVSDHNNLMTTLTGRLVHWTGTVGPAISDYNRRLILLYGIQFCRGQHALSCSREMLVNLRVSLCCCPPWLCKGTMKFSSSPRSSRPKRNDLSSSHSMTELVSGCRDFPESMFGVKSFSKSTPNRLNKPKK